MRTTTGRLLSLCLLTLLPVTGLAADRLNRVKNPMEFDRMRSFLELRNRQLNIRHRVVDRKVDCVDAHSQPGGPMVRHASPDELVVLGAQQDEGPYPTADFQCPGGTVPYRHIDIDDLERFETLEQFFLKSPVQCQTCDPGGGGGGGGGGGRVGSTDQHQYATAGIVRAHVASMANVTIWLPYVDAHQFSLGQVWSIRGSGGGLQSVEAGWQVYPDRLGDSLPHFFVFSTSANYSTGSSCYDSQCGRWVQVDGYFHPGMVLWPGTVTSPAEIFCLWHRDPATGDWVFWTVYYSGGVLLFREVGYYPARLFNASGLGPQADYFAIGGEITDIGVSSHVVSDMGNGQFAQLGYRKAAYVRDAELKPPENMATYPQPYAWAGYVIPAFSPIVTDSACYSLMFVDGSYEMTGSGATGLQSSGFFYFGGPGYNTNCQ